MMPSAIGERTELWSATEQNRVRKRLHALASEMQHADQREKAAGGVGVDIGLSLKPLLQDAAAFVVNAAPGHVDGFDLAGRQRFSRR